MSQRLCWVLLALSLSHCGQSGPLTLEASDTQGRMHDPQQLRSIL